MQNLESQTTAQQVDAFLQDVSKTHDIHAKGIITEKELKFKVVDRICEELISLLDLKKDEEGKITLEIQRAPKDS